MAGNTAAVALHTYDGSAGNGQGIGRVGLGCADARTVADDVRCCVTETLVCKIQGYRRLLIRHPCDRYERSSIAVVLFEDEKK